MHGSTAGGTEIHVAGAGFAYVTQAKSAPVELAFYILLSRSTGGFDAFLC